MVNRTGSAFGRKAARKLDQTELVANGAHSTGASVGYEENWTLR
jgi:hypothetical protein